ncbi:MAG: hypothetical protein ACREP9_20080 [Candidatus Dormibacteraceae bacterium]
MSVPLLGQPKLPEPEPIDLYDHEVLAITEIVNTLTGRHSKMSRNYRAVEAEIHDRFNDAGFLVYVNWYFWMLDEQTQEGCLPQVTVIGRIDKKHEFDHDRQVHEVVNNILGIPGADGVIKTDKDTLKNFLGGNGGDHAHGHRH